MRFAVFVAVALSLVGGATDVFAYTADGSVTTDSRGAGFQYLYNDAGRLVTVKENGVTAATYGYNALGQRVIKTAGAATTHFHYDRDGRLLAETDGTGAVVREYIHLDALPLALVDSSGTLYHVHPDHLATPQKMTDAAQTVVWDAQLRPFGEAHGITGTAGNDQRFPGQFHDAETGFHYNYFRDYDPSMGRYLQSDPIGLEGGLNTYSYALENPVINTDPTGEAVPAVIGLCAINPLCRAAAVRAGQLLADALAAGIGIYAMSQDDATSTGAGRTSRDVCDDAEDGGQCEELYATDTATCNGISRKRGATAGEACHASASERFAACLAGRPIPPLNTWNN